MCHPVTLWSLPALLPGEADIQYCVKQCPTVRGRKILSGKKWQYQIWKQVGEKVNTKRKKKQNKTLDQPVVSLFVKKNKKALINGSSLRSVSGKRIQTHHIICRWTNRRSGKTLHQNDTTLTLHLTGHITANCGNQQNDVKPLAQTCDVSQIEQGPIWTKMTTNSWSPHKTFKPAFERCCVWFSSHGERRTELLPDTDFLFQ